MTMVQVGSERVEAPVSHSPSTPSKFKTYAFAIAIIMGLCAVIIGVVGVGGFALNTMGRGTTIPLMSIGGGGIALWIVGLVGAHQKKSMDSDPPGVYGAEKWLKIWGVKVLDRVPPPPYVDLSKGDSILFYVPQIIEFEGKRQNLTLSTFKDISTKINADKPLFWFNTSLPTNIDISVPPRWILIHKKVLPEIVGKSMKDQQQMLKDMGYDLPRGIEALLLCLTIFRDTGEQLITSSIFIRCSEPNPWPIVMTMGQQSSMLCVYDYVGDPLNDHVHAPLCVRRF